MAALGAGPAEPLIRALRALARQESGLALRLAMVLACIKQFDVAELGYSGFIAFCRERVDWGQAWLRALVRLVESPLDHVKAAAAAGSLPLRLAVLAPGHVQPHEQIAWLGRVLSGGAARGDPAHKPSRHVWHGAEAEILHRARELARVCIGRAATVGELDAFILRHWREQLPGKALEEARITPRAPEVCTLDFTWAGGARAVGSSAHSTANVQVQGAGPEPGHGGHEPAGPAPSTSSAPAPGEALLGPWRAPEDLTQALAQLESVQALRRGRVTTLAHALTLVQRRGLWAGAGFDSPWDFARRVLGWSRRTAQRYLALGGALERFPQLEQALDEGLAPRAAALIGGLTTSESVCRRWVDLARHLGQQELLRATESGGAHLSDYERALAIARRNAAALLGPDGPTTKPAGTVPVFVSEGSASDDPSAPAAGTPSSPAPDEPELRVALPVRERERPLDAWGTHPDLPEAARWFLENNRLRDQPGFASVKGRARYRCQNPECGRQTLRVEAHHIHWRRHGGSDDPANGVALCPSCHLRGVHTSAARIRVSRVVVEGLEALLWEYPGRAPVLQFREVP